MAGDSNDELHKLALAAAELVQSVSYPAFDFDRNGQGRPVNWTKILGASEDQLIDQFATQLLSSVIEPGKPNE
ncbi:MAG: hypothetical protein A2496_23505 [Burkholderiales bacterium RIFOXYC12_FULL_60_6]|nr:MAG: hypothetical protein A2496_23505 [Burkholderiales bacterium RIFOXYC12_FULL_60_6]